MTCGPQLYPIQTLAKPGGSGAVLIQCRRSFSGIFGDTSIRGTYGILCDEEDDRPSVHFAAPVLARAFRGREFKAG